MLLFLFSRISTQSETIDDEGYEEEIIEEQTYSYVVSQDNYEPDPNFVISLNDDSSDGSCSGSDSGSCSGSDSGSCSDSGSIPHPHLVPHPVPQPVLHWYEYIY